MVPQSSFIAMAIVIVFAVAFPVGLVIYFVKKKWMSWKALVAGIITFIVFSQVLEKLLHLAVIDPSGPSLKWSTNPYLFALYGALAAGIFEEVGRYIVLRFFLKKSRTYEDGLSFGLGHGGIEVLLIAGLNMVLAIVYSSLINSGQFEATLGSALPSDQVEGIKNLYLSQTFGLILVGGLERVPALIFHIVFSLIVLRAVVESKIKYLFIAILIHAAIDFVAALYQIKVIPSIWVIEVFFLIAGSLFFFVIKKAKSWIPSKLD
ncbi:YhfC family intramembrane metalloprotease [Neobacillus sp. D3-1R]|uniref:YhfC family intramembrane metalloprotease n=1 Tax=Neobacillus sp. D3-1R TaxID=3445778 RepID=UPI003FA15E57